MERIILYPTPTSQWQALINEAQVACSLQLNPEVESYLVFLLMRHSDDRQLATTILAEEFLDSMKVLGRFRGTKLRDLGDRSLLFAGLFPGLADKRHVNLNYFVEMGQSAYGILSDMNFVDLGSTFATLSEDFESIVDVLAITRDIQSP